MNTVLSLAFVAWLAVAPAASGYPRPATVPYRWELNFQPGPLRVHVDGDDGRAYWYFTYEVTNNTGRDQTWAPDFTLFTDAGEILPCGRDVPVRVTRALLDLLGDDLLLNQNEAIGDLLQGAEHARSGLVIWPVGSVAVNELSLFIKGISGESSRIPDPVSGQLVVLYKTLHCRYLIPGDMLSRSSTPVEMVDQSWILR